MPTVEAVEAKLKECFLLVFPELTADTVGQASSETVARWDSVAQITLLSLIGEKFNMSVDFEYFEGATSFGVIKERVQELLQNA